MEHKMLKRKGKNTQPESSFRREHKGLLRRIFAFVIAAAVMTTGMPMQQIADNMPDLDIISKIRGLIPDAAMKAAAAEPQYREYAKEVSIASGQDLEDYVNGTLKLKDSGELVGYNEKDTLTITLNESACNLKNFVGIGTADHPFAGKVTIVLATESNPYGVFTGLTWENSSLFNYVTTDAVVTNQNSSDKDKPVYLKAGGTGTEPLFAKHVVKGENDTPQTWHIVVDASARYGGVIGDLGKDAKADIHVGYLNNADVVGGDTAGGICGTMQDNSALSLSVTGKIKDTKGAEKPSKSLGSVSANKFAGGVIGQMNTGAVLTIKEMPKITDDRMITATDGSKGNAAGGLVGKADGAKIAFADGVSYTNSGTLKVTVTDAPSESGAGGVFGVYSAAEGAEFDIDLSDYKLTGTINVSANAGGGFAGRFELNGLDENKKAANITIGKENADENSCFNVTANVGTVGGILGKLLTNESCLENTVTIKNVNTNVTITDNKVNGGGIVGDLGWYKESKGRTYLKIDGTNKIVVNETEAKGNSGGIAYSVYSSFLDICGENTISGNVESGVVDKVVDYGNYGSVVRFSGKTDISGVEDVKTALLVNLQTDGGKDDGLIYALGSGSNYDSATKKGWTYIRPEAKDTKDTKMEDVAPWGQVIRLIGDKTIEEAGVVSYDTTAHTVTLKGLTAENNEYKIANTVDFMKLALCIQHNTATKSGAFTTSGCETSASILKKNITLTGDVDLSGTGLRGITRDDGGNTDFTGTLDGGNHKITLAIGEAYGYRGADEAKNEAGKDNGNTGAVYDHKFQGLFAEISKATIKDLTLDGSICIDANADDIYCGAAAAQFSGNTTAENVKSNVNIIMRKDAHRIDVGTIFGVDSDTANVTLKDCTSYFDMTLAGNANSSYNGVSAGTIGHVKNSGSNVTVNDLTIRGEMKNSINLKKDGKKVYHFYGYGGLIGVVEHQTTKHEIKLNNVKVSNFSITDSSDNNGTGGLLGGSWNNVNVTIGENSSHDKGVTVDGSNITVGNSASKTIGGLVTSSYGYWQVNSLKYTNSSINSENAKASVVGLIVGKGYEDRTLQSSADNTPINNAVEPKRLYLEITDPSAYECASMTYKGTAGTYDEIVGRTMKGDDIGASGEGFVSIRTSGNKLNMDSSNSNEYKPKTDLGKTQPNQYTRYYYDLDYLREKASQTGGEKATLWSAYTYAAKNIRDDYFSKYSTFPTEETVIDLTGLSYYPVDVSNTIARNRVTFKLYNKEIQNAHGTKYSTWAYSQHYLMQCGLFRNVTKNITLTNCTISGTAAAYRNSLASATEKLNVQGSGALICGNLEGSSTQKASFTISGLALDGLTINNLNKAGYNTANMALLVRNIGSYTETKISGVSTSGYADKEKAASALIGTAGSDKVLQMTIQFSDMRLDGRKTTSDVNAAAQTAFENSYKTKSSIFTKATLIHTLQYTSEGGSSAIYNYNYDEDWAADGSAKHNVTYGKEISHSKEFAPDAGDNDQRRYLDKHAADDTNHFTSPESAEAKATAATSSTSGVKGGFDFSSFLPYVATEYGGSVTNAHEIAVNHVSKEMGKGCGTYNDPFIIDDGTTLSLVAEILSSGNVSKGFSMYIDNDHLNAATKDKNFEKWDSDKAGGKGHTRIEYNGSEFVAVKKSGDEWVEDTSKSISITKADVCSYLAGAYYLVEGNAENGGTITLSEKFAGLGQAGSDYAFRGVITGKKYNGNKMVIENPSDKPFVSVSNGCVVKDLDIKVTAKTITLTNDKNGADGQLTYDNGTPVYGAVIGRILGGDNIIDDVSVSFSNTKIQLKTSKNNNDYYKYTTVIPVGGYVGAVVNGGLVFRNMGSEKISPLGKDNFEVYKNTSKQNNVDVLNNYLYVNQIVGRVVNAYCFNEAGSYSIASTILDNSDKNYPIPDLNPNSDSKISFKQENGKDVKTMVVPDSQSLFILSEITQSMCGNAGTDGNYTVKKSYGGENKTTHLAKYSAVGTDDTTQPSDFTLAKKDSTGKADAVPYIIRQYTKADTDGSYPARAITGSGNYHYMELAENAKYDLPNCFRGVGQLYPQEMGDSEICKNILALYGLDGNGSTIKLNTNLKNHSSEWDCYYRNTDTPDNNADKIGLGLFNDLYFDVKAKTDDDRKEKSNSIHDLTLSGELTQEQWGDNKKIKMTSDTNKAANTGGIIGSLRYTASDTREYNFWNVSLDGLTISGERATGGFIGYVPDKSLSIYINECSANDLSVKGTLAAAGGVIGYMLGNANLYVNTLTEKSSEFNESVTSDTTKVNTNCGGIIGQLCESNSTLSKVIIRNVTVTAPENKHMGNNTETTNSALNGVGGAIGLAYKSNVLLINFNLKNVDMYGKNVAGLIGNANTGLNVKAYNCNVEGNGNSKLSGIEHVGGLFGYFPATGTGTIEGYSNHIDGCSVSGYTISQTNASNGAGGLIGTNNAERKICNSKVENCTIKGGNSLSRIGGIIGNNTNGNISAYNIVVNNVNLETTSPYHGLFSGYSGGKTFNIVGWSVQGDNTKADKVFGGTSSTNTTVIPADYNGACLDESTRGENLSDITTATNISRVDTSDDNFPYATSSPAKNVGTGTKFLTGDGTSAEAVESIIAEYNDTKYGAKRYNKIGNDIANYKQLTFSTEQDNLQGIPVILIDDTGDIKDQINSYLSILTNNQVSKASAVKVYKANISGDNVTLSESTNELTVEYGLDDKKQFFNKFKAKSDKFDSDTRGQFTLIDVQYTDPTVSSNAKVVYHVYVPVMTRKIYQYDFYTTAFSGTQYYPSKYTDETGDNGFNGSKPKVLVENYDTPVTAYLRWAYPADTFIKDIMGGSSGLDWNYNKVLNLNVNFGGTEKTIPKGTQFVLIDKNNKNKEYYYTITGKEKYNGEILQLPFSDFTDSSGKAFSEADFSDMVSSQLEFTKTTKADGLFVEDEKGNMTVMIGGKKTTIRTANDGDTDRFDLSTYTGNLTEDYYLTMTTAKAEKVLFHQFQLTTPSSLYPNVSGKINGAVQNKHSVQLNFADLFSNTIEVETLEDNTNVVMDDENNDVNITTVSTITFNTTDKGLISALKALLKNNNISIYHSSHIFMNKRSTNHGVAEKMIGDIDGIEMIKGADTIAAYDSTGVELTDPPKLEYDTVCGKASANFFEVSEQNNEKAIDLRPWLTAGETGVAPEVKIKTSFKIIYTHSGIVTQFPERQNSAENTDVGTYVSARSSLAYDAADTTYSSVSGTVKDSKNCLYYRNAMTDASLKFNAYHPISSGTPDEDRGDGQTKANDQLGINTFDEETETNSLIHTNGIYDASQISALDKKNLNIRWTIELQCKQNGYTDDLKLSDYLNSVTIKGVDEQTLETFNSGELGKTKLEYSAARDNFEELDNAGLFDVYIDFDVKTGADLEAVENAFYSNYKIVLTASLYEGSAMIDGSAADDYIIYTNAHIDPKFIDKAL